MQNCIMISKADLDYNVHTVLEAVQTPVIAVVKCNGYGITMQYAMAAWYNAGVRFFAVSEPAEALTIRELGYKDVQILLMAPVFDPPTLQLLLANDIILTITSAHCAVFAVENSGGYPIQAHVKIDTGMGRFGTRYDNIQELLAIYAVEGIRYSGIFSHFAISFEPQYQKTKQQLDLFLSAIRQLEAAGIQVGTKHIANSCAAFRFPETRLDAVRIGSALVGRLMVPCGVHLKKIGSLRARVVDIVQLKKGDTSGYAMIAKLKKDTTAAVVAVGYRQGFGITRCNENRRLLDMLRNIYHAIREYKKPAYLYHGKDRLPVVGRIGNQYTLVDITGKSLDVNAILSADINLLLADSLVDRVLE